MKLGEERAVTAKLVLCGLPYASFSSILAHEAMHAMMKLDQSYLTCLSQEVTNKPNKPNKPWEKERERDRERDGGGEGEGKLMI